MALTDQQRRFCEHLVGGLSSAEAARRAGYSPKSAGDQGSRLSANVEIQDYCRQLRDAASEEAAVSIAWLVKQLAKLAKDAEKERDRIAAIKLLGDHLGAWEPVKKDEGGLGDALRAVRERRDQRNV